MDLWHQFFGALLVALTSAAVIGCGGILLTQIIRSRNGDVIAASFSRLYVWSAVIIYVLVGREPIIWFLKLATVIMIMPDYLPLVSPEEIAKDLLSLIVIAAAIALTVWLMLESQKVVAKRNRANNQKPPQ